MIKITFDSQGIHLDSAFSIKSFKENGSAEVEIICKKKQFGEIFDIENKVCDFLSTQLNEKEYFVTTHNVTLNSQTYSDITGHYVEYAIFQIELGCN